jgi:hypothetical protein
VRYRIFRNTGDALYRYLPGSVTDFADGRVIARSSKWSSERASVPGRRRIVERIQFELSRFRGRDPAFPDSTHADRYEFFEPNTIELQFFPLTIFDADTGYHHRFGSLEQLDGYLRQVGREATIRQRDLVHIASNGEMESLMVPRCHVHGLQAVILDTSRGNLRQFVWKCSICKNSLGGVEGFAGGQRVIGATPVRSTSAFIPQIITMVRIATDIEEIGPREALDPLIIAKYLGLLSQDFDLRKGVSTVVPSASLTAAQLESIAKRYGIKPSEVANILQEGDSERKAPAEKAVSEALKAFPEIREKPNVTVSIFEYLMLRGGRATSLHALETEASGSQKDKFSTFRRAFDSIGVSEAFHVPVVPLIQAAYGYTRGDFDPQNTIVRSFPPDGMDREGHVPIYVNITESEGILLVFDRKRILDWLTSNEFLLKEESVKDEKSWFLRYISPFKPSLVTGSSPVSEREVFILVHTLAHALTKSITLPSGLSSESIGELFFPNVPAVLLYTHEGGGFKTGGLEDLFQNKAFTWLKIAVERLKTCVYDPVCYSSQAACHHCLFISEVACSHFNADLSRKVIFGSREPKLEGFWQATVDQLL